MSPSIGKQYQGPPTSVPPGTLVLAMSALEPALMMCSEVDEPTLHRLDSQGERSPGARPALYLCIK